MSLVDFHCHSKLSGGKYTISELCEIAKKRNCFLAITDTDNAGQLSQVKDLHEKQLVGGIEFTTYHKGYEVHILGYCLEKNKEFESLVAKIRRKKMNRIITIYRKLKEIDSDVANNNVRINQLLTWELGDYLIKKGFAKNAQEVYELLAKWEAGVKATSNYVLSQEVVQIIRQNKGVSVIAHPSTSFLERGMEMPELCQCLEEIGMDGIELYNNTNSVDTRKRLLQFAQEHHLIITGGSGYYNDNSECNIGEYQKQQELPQELCQEAYERIFQIL